MFFAMWWGACATEIPSDPGRVVLHRLNRAEYNATVRDLFGTTLRPADRFPADDFALGFDNQAHALSWSPLHLEQYDQAADELLDELFAVGTVTPTVWTREAEGTDMVADHGAIWDATGWILWTEGSIATDVWLPTAGDHEVRMDLLGMQGGDALVSASLAVDGAEVTVVDIAADVAAGDPTESHTVRLTLTAGHHEVEVAFLNDLKEPGEADRNLIVDRITVTGPLDVPRQPPAGADRVLVCDPVEIGEPGCAEAIVRQFGRRAWRRPLLDAEVDALLGVYGTARGLGADWTEAIRTILKTLLVSPHFVYRVEAGPIPGTPHALDGLELASRLSYFLWSSTPDDRLLDLGTSGALTDPDVLEAEARRLLADPRGVAVVENLGGQWLSSRRLDAAAPDPGTFPEFDEGLRAAMADELRALASDILRADRSMLDLVTTTRAWVDPRLAEHYGLSVDGPGPRWVDVPGRPGWMGRAGWLTALSYPDRTSPVLRGQWVLESLLCDAPPPPPVAVSPIDASDPEAGDLTLREQLEQHVSDPACASCHISMDAIGFALDGFDALGRSRTVDPEGRPLDLTGELPGLGAFDGPEALAELLVTDPRLPGCITETTFTYALGRAPTEADADRLDAIRAQFVASGYRFEALVVEIVRSRPFRFQGAP